MRHIKKPCSQCLGRGYHKVTVEYWPDDCYYGRSYLRDEKETCRACKGAGFTTMLAPDDIRCVCGKKFASIEELAAHRKEHA